MLSCALPFPSIFSLYLSELRYWIRCFCDWDSSTYSIYPDAQINNIEAASLFSFRFLLLVRVFVFALLHSRNHLFDIVGWLNIRLRGSLACHWRKIVGIFFAIGKKREKTKQKKYVDGDLFNKTIITCAYTFFHYSLTSIVILPRNNWPREIDLCFFKGGSLISFPSAMESSN